ncbi:MAG: 2TM domain-containing protein [Acidimicrobiia bacterium]
MQRQRDLGDRRFTDEEVGEIIRLASRLDDSVMGAAEPGLSFADVRRIASELGIPEAAVAEAAARQGVESKRSRRLGRLRRAWRTTLQIHGFVYVTTIAGIGAIDLAGGNGFDFVQYPMFGWGIILAWHGGLTWLLGRKDS